jgi:predicted RNA methylase
MSALYLPGLEAEQRNPAKSQWYTEPKLSQRVWNFWANNYLDEDTTGVRVLEPAAGQGALLKPVFNDPRVSHITAIDIDRGNCDVLEALARRESLRHARIGTVRVVQVHCMDFMQYSAPHPFDLALQNPPYEDGQDVQFVLHALRWAPVVLGIFRSALLHGQERFENFWRWVDPVRGSWLVERPQFGKGEKSDGPLSDFVVLLLCKRSTPRERGQSFDVQMEWW